MADRQEQLTVIGADTLVRGEIIAQSASYILGKVEGNIVAHAPLQIGLGAVCKANIQGTTVVIEGTVEGNVIASEKLELKPSALIKGDMTAAKLTVTEGAAFTGHCAVGADAVATAQQLANHQGTQSPTARSAAQPNGIYSNGATSNRSTVTTTEHVDSALAGLEAKLAGFNKSRATAEVS
jgi:cytoskeletal protein CcmA (bactofilin family)